MASKKYPPEVRDLAYTLHTRGLSRPEIQIQVNDYCRKKLKWPGPTLRTLDQWRVEDDWEAQDELLKADVATKLRERAVKDKVEALEDLDYLVKALFSQLKEQILEGVRVPLNQGMFGWKEMLRDYLKLLEEHSKGVDVRKLLKSAMGPFIEILQEELGQAFAEKQDVIFDKLVRKLKAMEKISGG